MSEDKSLLGIENKASANVAAAAASIVTQISELTVKLADRIKLGSDTRNQIAEQIKLADNVKFQFAEQINLNVTLLVPQGNEGAAYPENLIPQAVSIGVTEIFGSNEKMPRSRTSAVIAPPDGARAVTGLPARQVVTYVLEGYDVNRHGRALELTPNVSLVSISGFPSSLESADGLRELPMVSKFHVDRVDLIPESGAPFFVPSSNQPVAENGRYWRARSLRPQDSIPLDALGAVILSLSERFPAHALLLERASDMQFQQETKKFVLLCPPDIVAPRIDEKPPSPPVSEPLNSSPALIQNSEHLLPIFSTDPLGENREVREFEFQLDEQKHPIKLGDGAFGSVWKVRPRGGDRYDSFALKVLYEGVSQDSKERFMAERDAYQKVRSSLALPGKGQVNSRRLVLPRYGVSSFKSMQAFARLSTYFNDRGISVSDYGLLMEEYHGTLKDLLERAVSLPSGKQAGQLYDKLMALEAGERTRIVARILKDVASGLRELHRAGYCHHDLKPANIFYREVNDTLEFAVGDLGYILPSRALGSKQSTSHDLLPLGSRHYRAPEQRDYFDACEVVIQDDSILLSNDPRFFENDIHKDDHLVFLSDPERMPRKIQDIQPGKGITTTIKLESTGGLQPGEKTQIMLYRNHNRQTDVFGIGALFYDLATGGRSAEYAYDALRVNDHKDRIIDTLVDAHEAYRGARPLSSVSDESLGEVFLDRNRRHALSESGVRFVLRCLVRKAAGSFVNTCADERDSILEAIETALETLAGTTTDSRVLLIATANRPADSLHQSEQTLFDELKALTKPIGQASADVPGAISHRLCKAYLILRHIDQCVKSIRTTSTARSLLPGNFLRKGVNGFEGPIREVMPSLDELKNDLSVRSARHVVPDYSETAFMPLLMRVLRIRVEPAGGGWRASGGEAIYPQPMEGDLFQFQDPSGKWQVSTLNGENLKTVTQSGWLIRKMNPQEYYLRSMALYLYQLFLAEIPERGNLVSGLTVLRQSLAVEKTKLPDKQNIKEILGKKAKDYRAFVDTLLRTHIWFSLAPITPVDAWPLWETVMEYIELAISALTEVERYLLRSALSFDEISKHVKKPLPKLSNSIDEISWKIVKDYML